MYRMGSRFPGGRAAAMIGPGLHRRRNWRIYGACPVYALGLVAALTWRAGGPRQIVSRGWRYSSARTFARSSLRCAALITVWPVVSVGSVYPTHAPGTAEQTEDSAV